MGTEDRSGCTPGDTVPATRYALRMSTPSGRDPGSLALVPAWEAARQAGWDMDLIEDCLALSPSERLRVHTVALLTAEALRRAMKEREDAAALAARVPPRK